MHKHFFSLGPGALYHTVPDHIRTALRKQIPSISHRSSTFQAMYRELCNNLRELLQIPDSYSILILSSATEAMERILQNCVIESSTHLINGSFAERFARIARDLQLETKEYQVPWGECVIPETLPQDTSPELIALTHNETSTGAMQAGEDIERLRRLFPDSLLAVDIVSSAPYINFPISLLDSCFFSVQKGFGLPAGLGIWIVNERCMQKAEHKRKNGHSLGSYHSLPQLMEKAASYQTPETPNVLAIYLLSQVTQDMLERGRQVLENETKYKAALLYNTLESLPYLRPFVQDKNYRSKTTITAELQDPRQQADLLAYFDKKGYVLSPGHGKLKSSCIRIANFPAHSRESVEQLSDFLTDYASK